MGEFPIALVALLAETAESPRTAASAGEPQASACLDLYADRLAVFRRVITEGVAAGEFAVVSEDATLQAMHAAMSQAPLWCSHLAAEAQDHAMDDLADTLVKLVAR